MVSSLAPPLVGGILIFVCAGEAKGTRTGLPRKSVMNSRLVLLAYAVLVLAGGVRTSFAQAEGRATLENLLAPPQSAPAKPYDPAPSTTKLAVPDKSAANEAVELIRQAYEDDLKSAQDRPEPVIAKFVSAAEETEDPARKYALLLVAEDVAAEAGASALALKVLDTRVGIFDIDALLVRLALLEKLSKQGASVDCSLFECVVQAAQRAMHADRFEEAGKAADLAESTAKAIGRSEKSQAAEARKKRLQAPEPIAAGLLAEVSQIKKAIREKKALSAEYMTARERLSANPDDADAAEVVGMHLCFARNDWEEGLKVLSHSKNKTLKSLATRELAGSETTEPDARTMFALAGDWWKLAEAEDSSLHESHAAAVKVHAADIYSQLVKRLSDPIDVAIAEKRIASARESSGGDSGEGVAAKAAGKRSKAVNLLSLVDANRDAVSGRWQMTTAGIVSDGAKPAKLKITYKVPVEYDFLIEFTHLESAGNATQICSFKDCAFVWAMGHYQDGKYFGFEQVDGQNANNNRTTAIKQGIMVVGRRHLSVVRVRKDGVAAFLNNVEISSLKTDYTDVSIKDTWSVPRGSIGIATWRSPTVFHRIELTPVGK